MLLSPYHGSGGYKTSVPGWDKKDANLIARGIIPATQQLPRRARNWFYGHDGNIDKQIGELIAPPSIVKPKEELLKVIQEVQEGKFIPDRERDVLQSPRECRTHRTNTRTGT
jgi:hypothetical protein